MEIFEYVEELRSNPHSLARETTKSSVEKLALRIEMKVV